MNIPKRILWIGLAAFFLLGTGAALAQDNPPPHPNDQGNPPPAQRMVPPTLPDGTVPPAPFDGTAPELPENFDPQNRPPRPPMPVYIYTASLTCDTATRLDGETQGEVAQSYSSLRDSIGSSTVLAVMPGGATFDILAGPVCSGGYNWYQVSYNGITGWATEGYAGSYWLEPVSLD